MPYFYLFVVLGLPPSAHMHHQQHTPMHTYAHTQRHTYAHTTYKYTQGPLHCCPSLLELTHIWWRPHWESITLLLHFLLVRRVFKCILRVCAYLFAQLLGVGSRKTTCVHGRLIGNPNYINSKK